MNKNNHKNILMALLFMLIALPGSICATSKISLSSYSCSPAGLSNQQGDKLFDGNTGTKWCDYFYGTATIVMQASGEEKPYSYYFYTGDDCRGGDRNPKSWTLYGSNNSDRGWEVLSSVSDGKLPKVSQRKSLYYKIDPNKATKSYKYYKLEITALQSGNTSGQAFEISEFCINTGKHVFFTPTYSNYANGVSDDETYLKAFNDITNDKWCGKNYHNRVDVEFEASELITLSSYYLYTGDDVTYNGTNRNPKNWRLMAKRGSSDSWTTIAYESSGNLPTTNSTMSSYYYIYDSYKSTPFKYFRYEFDDVVNGDVFEIGEFKMNCTIIDKDNPEVKGEENTTSNYGVRSGRLSNVATVTENGATYTLYKDYYYIPKENNQKQTGLKKSVSGYCCVLTSCRTVGSLEIPSSVTFNVYGVDVVAPVVAIGEEALGYSSNNVQVLIIPENVVVVEKYALEDRKSADAVTVSKLHTIRFDDSDTPIFLHRGSGDYSALSKAGALRNIYFGRNMEYNSAKHSILESSPTTDLTVTFGDKVTTIPENMFKNATGLKSLTLAKSITAIPASMCYGCTGLTSMKIPASVTTIGNNAFTRCSNINTYTFSSLTPCTIGSTDGTLSGVADFKIYVPNDAYDSYIAEATWKKYAYHIVKPQEAPVKHSMVVTEIDGTITTFDLDEVESVKWVVAESSTDYALATIEGNEVKVKWLQLWEKGPRFAEFNVGATSATEYGGYYCWGGSIDRDPNRSYNRGSAVLTGSDDTATNLWGSNWRMPTAAELQALLDNCNVAWTDNYKGSGVKGRIYTGKGDYSENSIFLPAGGFYTEHITLKDEVAVYWSSSPDDPRVLRFTDSSQDMYNGVSVSTGVSSLNNGMAVRAVYNPQGK